MAVDEALLERAEAGVAVVRTYEWVEPTLSLGYFQRLADARAEERFRDVTIVRRPTGGGALWHHWEITYAIILPRDHDLARRHSDLYDAVHLEIAHGLSETGARRRGAVGLMGRRPFLCFSDQDPADVLVGRWKVVGSAQRRRAGAVLQHGSVLLARSDTTPELPGLAEATASNWPDRDWPDWLQERLLTACGLEGHASDLTAGEREWAQALIEKYDDPTWTARR